MISDLIGAFASLVSTVGLWNCFLISAGLVVILLVWRMLERLDRSLSKIEKRWRRMSPTGRMWSATIGGCVAAFLLWHVVPRSPMGLALLMGAGTVWFLGGMQHLRRYNLVGVGPMAGWRHHYRVTRGRHQLTQAADAASVKDGVKAGKPTITEGGATYTLTPPFGQSPEELAEEVNSGRHKSSVEAHVGWACKSMTAIVREDGKVQVTVSREQTVAEADPLADPHWWDVKL